MHLSNLFCILLLQLFSPHTNIWEKEGEKNSTAQHLKSFISIFWITYIYIVPKYSREILSFKDI